MVWRSRCKSKSVIKWIENIKASNSTNGICNDGFVFQHENIADSHIIGCVRQSVECFGKEQSHAAGNRECAEMQEWAGEEVAREWRLEQRKGLVPQQVNESLSEKVRLMINDCWSTISDFLTVRLSSFQSLRRAPIVVWRPESRHGSLFLCWFDTSTWRFPAPLHCDPGWGGTWDSPA